jgi:peroxidase
MPNERSISNAISHMGNDFQLSSEGINQLTTAFEQFISHDISLTNSAPTSLTCENRMIIPILETNDPFFNKTNFCSFSSIDASNNKITEQVNGQIRSRNMMTSWLDLNIVYGTTKNVSDSLRSFVDGKMLTSNLNIPNVTMFEPTLGRFTFNMTLDNYLPVLNQIPQGCFDIALQFPALQPDRLSVAGDCRVNRNEGLNLMHLLFVREHNKLAEELKAMNPQWTDETLFRKARALNIAKYQVVIYSDLLPTILSDKYQKRMGYYDYDADLDASISTVFGAAANRYGHSALIDFNYGLDSCARPIRSNETLSRFPNAGTSGSDKSSAMIAYLGGSSASLRGKLYRKAKQTGHLIPSHFRNLRTTPNPAGISFVTVDVNAIEIRAGRQLGLPDYNTVYETYNGISIYDHPWCSSTPSSLVDDIWCFYVITSNRTLATDLQRVYGKVNRIDPIVGMMSEDRVQGSSLGRTTSALYVDSFRRLRDGDRHFVSARNLLNMGFRPSTILDVMGTSMSDLLKRNFENVWVQKNAFKVPNFETSSLAEQLCGA